MSSRCMAAVFERYPNGGGEFALALALADNAHDDGTRIYPAVETMAHKSRQSVRAVQTHLRKMLAIGWLQLVKNARGGRGRCAEYRINAAWLKGAELAPFIDVVENPEKGAELGTKRVQNDALKGADSCTPYITDRTSIEPTPIAPASGGEGGLEAVIAEYPAKRVDLERAKRRWSRLAPDAELQAAILTAVRCHARTPEWQREEGRYAPMLSKWLRNKRWRDPVEQAAPSPLPTSPIDAPLTEEQLRVNGVRAREAIGKARALLGQKVALAA